MVGLLGYARPRTVGRGNFAIVGMQRYGGGVPVDWLPGGLGDELELGLMDLIQSTTLTTSMIDFYNVVIMETKKRTIPRVGFFFFSSLFLGPPILIPLSL